MDFVFTANAGTDQLTKVAHGLVTGDGPAVVRVLGGTLAAPLAALTEYWAIRVDANNIKLATSPANALGGIAIDLTTAGSGTQILEIGIPYVRARTYAAGSQVRSADLNATMDSLKELHRFNLGQAQTTWTRLYTRTFFPTAWRASVSGPTLVTNPDGAGAPVPVWSIATGQTVECRIPIEPGERVLGLSSPNGGLRAEVYGDGAIDIDVIQLRYLASLAAAAGTVVLPCDHSQLNVASGWSLATYVGNFDSPIATLPSVLTLRMTLSNGAQLYLGNLYIDCERGGPPAT